jgi:putative ABC transport system substrate-binding protein
MSIKLGWTMLRRDFIKMLAGSALALPSAAFGQQAERVQRIGILSNLAADDPEGRERNMALVRAMQELGWTEGRNLQIDYRFSDGNAERLRTHARELVGNAPDILFATSGVSIGPLQQASTSIPIVFAQTIDPVGQGVVESLSRPGGNVTGFTQIEFGITGKWLEMLKIVVPGLRRVAVLRDAVDPAGIGQWGALQSAAPALALELSMIDVRNRDFIERGIARLSNAKDAALLVTASAPSAFHRTFIMQLALLHRLPAIFPYAYFARIGGLISYGPETIDQYRRAASYVDRILKGEKPADLPVQAPTRYNLIVNLKTAKAIGITMPSELLVRADEVIE